MALRQLMGSGFDHTLKEGREVHVTYSFEASLVDFGFRLKIWDSLASS